ncbi:hypothetical protein [Nocardioides cynanchi]|uniref:hypothetical protein n=1 Tax=Nocardioides cynanchi TaxID=2558918 RepID=UPI0012458DD6|nr:hypothetical protein [Nocardioides cynanchi]
MWLPRIARSLAVIAVAAVLAGSTYDAGASTAPGRHAAVGHHVRDAGFTAPVPHRYGANGMRMGLHCEAVDLS